MNRPDVVATCETAKRFVGALLMATSEEVHEKLTRLDKGQPGSVLRALRLTRDRLTGERGGEVMLKGPTAERLTVRVNELVGNAGLVGARVFDLSEEDREHANRAPIALSIPLRDELVRASSTLDRLLVSAVELRNWRETSEAELASLVETSDPAANAIRHQRRAEIAGEIAHVSQRETELLGDVYDVSNAVRQSLEELTQLLSNLIRLGLGSIPKSQVIFQPVDAEQLSNMEIPDIAKRWSELPNSAKELLIANDYEKLRNLDGIDGPSRERMQENYIKSIIAEGGPHLRKLEELGFVEDGKQTQRFVYLSLQQRGDHIDASYVTAHGCDDYTDLQYVIEGTSTNPNSPKSLGNLKATDDKAEFLKKMIQKCRTFLVVRNVDFPDNIPEASWSSKFSKSDEEKILRLMSGLTASGAGTKHTSIRMHSAGNSFMPNLAKKNRDKFGVRMDVAIMDDAAMDSGSGSYSYVDLPTDIPIMYAIQEGAMSSVIRLHFGTDLVTNYPNVTVFSYPNTTQTTDELGWIASNEGRFEREPQKWWDVGAKVRNRGDYLGERLEILELYKIRASNWLGVTDVHSQGWHNPTQMLEESAFIEEHS